MLVSNKLMLSASVSQPEMDQLLLRTGQPPPASLLILSAVKLCFYGSDKQDGLWFLIHLSVCTQINAHAPASTSQSNGCLKDKNFRFKLSDE